MSIMSWIRAIYYHSDAKNKISELSDEVSRLRSSKEVLRTRLKRLEQKLTTMELVLADNKNEINELSNNNKKLKERIAMVSESKWSRIDKQKERIAMVSESKWSRIDKQIEDDEVKAKRLERNTIWCSCHGEVQSCYRCYGTGHYVVDGYGNRNF